MNKFQDSSLIDKIQRALSEEEYHTPTPIQAQTIPAALEGRDILGCAQTGTGKTAAFALPVLHHLGQKTGRARPNYPMALILAPTRELAIQIGDSCKTYGRHLQLRQAVIYGGVNQHKQVQALKRGVHILIATPGRLLDLMNQGHISLEQLRMFVLDEADRMLDMGFLPDIKRIIRELPEERQSLFFSATLSPKIVELTEELLTDPVSINVTPEKVSLEKIEQRLMYVDRSEKSKLLQKILRDPKIERALVFTKTKRGAELVAEQLSQSEISANSIHGDKSQRARQRALEAFKQNRIQVLVATDVAARGIDIDGISHVINYDLPMEPENYVHRIGRTGRAGADGIAISFCTSIDRKLLRDIETLIEQKIPCDPEYQMPQGRSEGEGPSKRKRRRSRPQKSFRGDGGPAKPKKRRTAPASAKRKSEAQRRQSKKNIQRNRPAGQTVE